MMCQFLFVCMGIYRGPVECKQHFRLENSDSGTSYLCSGRKYVTKESWEKLEGSFTLTSLPSRAIFYLEGPPPGVDILINSVIIFPTISEYYGLRRGKQVPPSQKKTKDKEKSIQLNEAVIPQEPFKPKVASANVDYNIISHLRKLPALISVYNALLMSKNLRETLIKALHNPEQYEAFFAEQNLKETLPIQNTATITFYNNDLLLGTADHNRPLYVNAESNNIEINRILIDSESFVNLMSLKTLKGLALDFSI
ncbi:hypothetical protein KFK09_004853 [Dendrobium nobile]|uniref:Uncharacterized protein n=1 Tax=Dendrobium nobile TaxID=94219 RepID=A0A8T3BU37_DENNO|nr:hypothetical protein KFK09_004853 [Dendrobium nobile]